MIMTRQYGVWLCVRFKKNEKNQLGDKKISMFCRKCSIKFEHLKCHTCVLHHKISLFIVKLRIIDEHRKAIAKIIPLKVY